MKYTKSQLKQMAEDFLCAYNLNDHRAEMMKFVLMSHLRMPEHILISKVTEMANYQGE